MQRAESQGEGASSAHPFPRVNGQTMRELMTQLLIKASALSLAAFLPLGLAAVVMWAASRPRGKSAT